MTKNMRQAGDNTFVDILNNIRVGELTMDQLEILDSRRIPLEGPFADGEAVRIFPTTKQVDANNSAMTKKLGKSGILGTLTIGIGSRVMLRRNINVNHGLVNGAMGIIRRIEWPSLRREQLEPDVHQRRSEGRAGPLKEQTRNESHNSSMHQFSRI
ncbi:hypothetical protein HW555_003792 [Spodoptera exigua]|uniref:DNA helicase Pif1-like 2B domain-containing protein n=1 Tax=Spodoptera exigua TaxID=7107 RepID=A0A835GNA0_SPOEX|nr:hypothetical protein HW555_003792 [Spodoptera exigua]